MNSIVELYTSSKALLTKKTALPAPFPEIVQWISDNLDVVPLNLSYDANFRRLNIVFKDQKGLEKFNFETKRKFGTVLRSSIHYQNILNNSPEYASDQLYLRVISFNHLASEYISTTSDLEQLEKELNIESLWKIHKRGRMSCVFFFHDNKAAEKYNEVEHKKYLIEKYFAFLKRKDEFNVLNKDDIFILVDSKENLDNNYQGSMQFYLRDH